MTDSSTESQASGSSENWYDVLAKMLTSLAGAIKDLPHWQRIGGFALVVAVLPITLGIYSLSSDPSQMILLSVIFLVWILFLMFIVYAFTKRQTKLRKTQSEIEKENEKLERLRSNILNTVQDKYQSLLKIESRLEKISTQIAELLQDHPDLAAEIAPLQDSVNALTKDVRDYEGGYDDFLRLMSGTEMMRDSKSVGASILTGKSSKKSRTQN